MSSLAKVEQWVDREKRVLGTGDAAVHSGGHGPRDFQHRQVRSSSLLLVFGSSVGDGFDSIDVLSEAPWKETQELVGPSAGPRRSVASLIDFGHRLLRQSSSAARPSSHRSKILLVAEARK